MSFSGNKDKRQEKIANFTDLYRGKKRKMFEYYENLKNRRSVENYHTFFRECIEIYLQDSILICGTRRRAALFLLPGKTLKTLENFRNQAGGVVSVGGE